MGWGKEKKKIHLVKRETVIRDKEDGRLDLKSMRNMNVGFLAKLGWR